MNQVVAVYGGSFDPVQNIHAQVPRDLLEDQRARTVLVLPAFGNPLKPQGSVADFGDRMKMLHKVFLGEPRIIVSAAAKTLWVERASRYSYDLLCLLKDRWAADAQFKLVLGTDILHEVNRWHRWDDIEREFGVLWVGREGYPEPPDGGRVYPNVSSTGVRSLLASGQMEAARAMVPPAIWPMLPGPYGGGARA